MDYPDILRNVKFTFTANQERSRHSLIKYGHTCIVFDSCMNLWHNKD